MRLTQDSSPSDPILLSRWVWRSYLRAALVPILLVEVALVAVYMVANHFSTQENIEAVSGIAREELRRIAQREANSIQNQLVGIARTTDMFRRQTGELMGTPYDPGADERNRYSYAESGAYYTTRDNGGAALFYSGAVPVQAEQREKAARSARLDPLMCDIQRSNPMVVQIYLNTHDSLNRIYPYFDVLGQYPPRMDIPTYNFYYEADAAHNPGRHPVWTDAYVDPAGKGWMVSCIAPVYRGDFLEGVVGLDITIEAITSTILNLAIPWQGYGVLIGKSGTVLALPRAGEEDWGLRELTSHEYKDAIREDTFKPESFNISRRPALAEVVAKPDGIGLLQLNGRRLAAWETIGETSWKLLVIVPEENILVQASQLGERLLRIGFWMIGGLVLFYCGFFVLLFGRAQRMVRDIAEPLERIDDLATRIGAGDYRQDAPGFAVAELRATAQGLVAMGAQLGDAVRQLDESRRDAEVARDAALEASRLKSEFLRTVSHELRTPLNGVLGMLDLLAMGDLDARQKGFARSARESGGTLLGLINDLIELSGIEAGQVAIDNYPFPVNDVVTDVARRFATAARAKGLELSTFVAPTVPTTVVGDGARLQQVLDRLVDNAIKFTDSGSVALRCEPCADRDGWLEFAVRDTGIGIPASALHLLFQPFTQVDGSMSRRHGGIGIGLNMSRRLVELMGGSIDVASEPGIGSIFRVRLPLAAPSAAPALPSD